MQNHGRVRVGRDATMTTYVDTMHQAAASKAYDSNNSEVEGTVLAGAIGFYIDTQLDCTVQGVITPC